MDRCLKKNSKRNRVREEKQPGHEIRRESETTKKEERLTEVRWRGEMKELRSRSRPGVSAKHYPAKKDNTPRVQYYNRLERKCIIENDR